MSLHKKKADASPAAEVENSNEPTDLDAVMRKYDR